MKRTDVLIGRIVQRVLSVKSSNDVSEIIVVHGVDKYHNVKQLVDGLFEYFPDSEITFKKLNYGYELKIKVTL